MPGPAHRLARTALAALSVAVHAHALAQDVHKCTFSGQVSYQSTPCAASDVVLPAPPTPSDQEAGQARGELSRQRLQAATGRIVRPVYVPPPPPPPPRPLVLPASTTTTTTTIVVAPAGGGGSVTVRQTTRTAPRIVYPAYQRPLNNCEKLNRDSADLTDRRQQLQAPSELASRQESLQKTQADLDHVQEMAKASNCKLAR